MLQVNGLLDPSLIGELSPMFSSPYHDYYFASLLYIQSLFFILIIVGHIWIMVILGPFFIKLQ